VRLCVFTVVVVRTSTIGWVECGTPSGDPDRRRGLTKAMGRLAGVRNGGRLAIGALLVEEQEGKGGWLLRGV
jgi:hypothetical protein